MTGLTSIASSTQEYCFICHKYIADYRLHPFNLIWVRIVPLKIHLKGLREFKQIKIRTAALF